MLFSYNWLNDYLKYKVSPDQLAELLTMHAFEVSAITKKGDDVVLDIDVLSNRAPDCFSHEGIAREANAIVGYKGIFRQKKPRKDTRNEDEIVNFFKSLAVYPELAIEIASPKDCPLYIALLMSGVKVSKSPLWLKERLEALGAGSINNLVDSANYAMLDTGQPTHIFDANSIAKDDGGIKNILVRRAREGEGIRVFGEARYKLTPEDLVIADAKKLLAIAGIKGGEDSGVSDKTTDIIIEAAHFRRENIYESAKRLSLATDSAKRFGAGIPQGLVLKGLFETAQLVKEAAGGEVKGFSGTYPPHLFKRREHILLSPQRVSSYLGVSIDEDSIARILTLLNFEVEKESSGDLKIHPPYFRPDITIAEDGIEEVGRMYGFNEITPSSPPISLIDEADEEMVKWRSFIRRYFASQGFDEVYNYSLTKTPPLSQGAVKLLNPISENQAYLRQSIVAGLCQNIALNQRYFSSLKIFEIGKTFRRENGEIKEREMLGGAVWSKTEKEVFREARGYAEGLLEACGITDYFERSEKQGSARSAGSYMVNAYTDRDTLAIEKAGILIAKILHIPPSPELKIKQSFAVFELNLETLVSQSDIEREFEEPPKYPAVIRDISCFLPLSVKAGSVIGIIHEIGKELIEDVDLFDMYEEQKRMQKSLAFHIVYRSRAKTLTDSEVNRLHAKIEKELTKRLHAQIR
ncbi:MAG: phenylalanine--tRNA ligase subunit beta [Candidatus Portnoybacteria bacterium]|nr:phenylalanine--tRNA ligase subunit beta [Candidatus Portnoybacteria bacterium]